jgi:hypothetical protein
VRSSERTGQPMSSRDRAVRRVQVDLRQWLGSDVAGVGGIDLSQPAAGGLVRWIRTTGGWVGVCNVVVTMTDNTTMKFESQLVPARALRPWSE